MRLIRNKATGEIRQVDDTQLSDYGLGAQPTATESTTSTQDPQKLRQVFTLMMMTQPKHADQIKSVYDMMAPKSQEPTMPTGTEQNAISSELQALQKIKSSYDLLNGGKATVGGMGGVIADKRLQHPWLNAILPGKPNQETSSLFDNLLQLQTLGERGQVGGRLTGYLLDRLGPGYPQLANDPEILKSKLKTLLNTAKQELESTAKMHHYASAADMPGIGDLSGYTINDTPSSGGVNADPLGLGL